MSERTSPEGPTEQRPCYLDEYREACEFIRTELKLRRVALAFVIAVQYGIISILFSGASVPTPMQQMKVIALPIIGVLITLVGINNELRLKKYVDGYTDRAHELEDKLGFHLLKPVYGGVMKDRCVLAGKATKWFIALYVTILTAWVLYFGCALWSHLWE